MIKFLRTLTTAVLLFGLSFTALDPILRQKMLEGENIITSFSDRIEDIFDNNYNSTNEPEKEIIAIPEEKEEEKEIINSKPEDNDNNNKEETNDNINVQIPEKEDKPTIETPSVNEEEKKEEKPKPTVTIKPFPNFGKEEEKEPEPTIPDTEEPKVDDTPIIDPIPEPTPKPEPEPETPIYTPVYYNQSVSEIGYNSGCLLTSYAMVITNAGRYTGNSKEYNPIDLYLANNPNVTSASQRIVLAYHYVIADGFNYTWNRTRFNDWKNIDKINKVRELLEKNPWGVIIGGEYGNGGTHFIVVRLVNGKLVFDDPVKSKGPNIQSIEGVYGINSWDKITSVMTVTPNLDKKGVWAPGTYEVKKKNPELYHICQTKMYC